jgi:hydrogenase maturation factor HypE
MIITIFSGIPAATVAGAGGGALSVSAIYTSSDKMLERSFYETMNVKTCTAGFGECASSKMFHESLATNGSFAMAMPSANMFT